MITEISRDDGSISFPPTLPPLFFYPIVWRARRSLACTPISPFFFPFPFFDSPHPGSWKSYPLVCIIDIPKRHSFLTSFGSFPSQPTPLLPSQLRHQQAAIRFSNLGF